MFHTINKIPTEFFAPPGFLYRFFLNPFWVVSASGLILLKGQASADIRPAAHVALASPIVARRDDRSVRFQAYRVHPARRDGYNKRGLETRVSLKMVLEALGFAGGTKSHTELNQWIETEKTKYSIKNRFHPSKGRNGF